MIKSIKGVEGNSRLITRDGEKPIKDLAGEEVKVLDGYGQYVYIKPFKTGNDIFLVELILSNGYRLLSSYYTELFATKGIGLSFEEQSLAYMNVGNYVLCRGLQSVRVRYINDYGVGEAYYWLGNTVIVNNIIIL